MSAQHPDVVDALRALGDAPVDPPTPRLAELERRLLDTITDAEHDRTLVLAFDGSRRRAKSVHRIVIGSVAACLLAAAVLAAGLLSTADDGVVIAAAVDVEVVLPNGRAVDGVPGLELPVGARVFVGGSLEVDGREYGPGEYTVEDGGLAPDGLAVGDVPSQTTPRVTAPTTSSTRPPGSIAPTTTPVAVAVDTRPSRPTDTRTPVTRTNSRPAPITRETVVPTTAPPSSRPDRDARQSDAPVDRPESTITTVPTATRPTTTPARTTTTIAVAPTVSTTIPTTTTTTTAVATPDRDRRDARRSEDLRGEPPLDR